MDTVYVNEFRIENVNSDILSKYSFRELCVFSFENRVSIPYPKVDFSGLYLIEIQDSNAENSEWYRGLSKKRNKRSSSNGWMPLYVGRHHRLNHKICHLMIHAMDHIGQWKASSRMEFYKCLFRVSTIELTKEEYGYKSSLLERKMKSKITPIWK